MYMMKYVDVIVRSMISNFILNLYEDAFFCIGAIAHYFFFKKTSSYYMFKFILLANYWKTT